MRTEEHIGRKRKEAPPKGRIQYVKRHNGLCKSIICEVTPDGRKVFSESESGEVRWHEFEASELERREAQLLLHRGIGRDCWAFMDLDALGSLRPRGRRHRNLRRCFQR